jgi:glycosyltransferase involved in cell wall biosynthesis
MIPPLFKRYKKKGAINIGFTMWEANKLPTIWTKLCNEMDGIMVPSEWNVNVFKQSGVTVPIYHVPAGIDLEEIPEYVAPQEKDEFKFYSIFQWLERKSPSGLVKAFMSEFTAKDKVSLTLKTYVRDKGENEAILHQAIDQIREEMKLKPKDHAPIKIITGLLSNEEVSKLHQEHDCFVLPHRGEGYGLPHQEAMLHGRPVISTGWSGNMDFMNDENSYLVDYQLTPCCNVGAFAPFYNGRMWWAEPDLWQLGYKMKLVYNNLTQASEVGFKARQHIIENFNNETSAKAFMSAIEQIGN